MNKKDLIKNIFLLAGLLPGYSLSADINIVEVNKVKNQYHLHMDTMLNAEIDTIKRIITDYEHLTLINPYLKESRILSQSKDGRITVKMLTESCLFFLCFNIRHVQTFKPIIDDILYARIIPEMSDFQSGWVRWKIVEIDSNKMYPVTQIIIDIEMTPDFIVPPVIGPYQIKRKMSEMAKATINNLEKKAKINSLR